MRIHHRSTFGASTLGLVAWAAGAICGCTQANMTLADSLRGGWETTDPLGSVERVCFDDASVRFQADTEQQYACPYRIGSVNDSEGKVTLRLRCKKRTGAESWIEHHAKFDPERNEFTLEVEGRAVGRFRRASK